MYQIYFNIFDYLNHKINISMKDKHTLKLTQSQIVIDKTIYILLHTQTFASNQSHPLCANE